ncbi:hypothetical protein LY13_003953 [Prauserella aidingensis]|uniref:hypothetical protein n=1 Tax=Prauserella aidingensis TaxID=387890 RepID=UPI0020A32A83|nr:hypothetical protein [Prauserella aidingensis]MCP2255179.1 hypothetical protein [Prauserella aidingensis]
MADINTGTSTDTAPPDPAHPDTGHAGDRGTATRTSFGSRVRRAAPPVLVYLAIRLVGVVVLAVMAASHDTSLLDRLTAWDGQWYLGIAEHGYAGQSARSVGPDGQPYPDAPFAFFPLYPAAMSIVATFGIPLDIAGLVVSTLAGVAAVPAVMRLARHAQPRPHTGPRHHTGPQGDAAPHVRPRPDVDPHRVGLLLVALWAGAPMSGVLSMVYTEATFLVLAAWALVGVLDRRWLLAGTCALTAGLVRPSAAVLIAVVVAAALHAAWTRRGGWPAALAAGTAPLGLLGWWLTVHIATGHTWQAIERHGWGVSWDWGADTLAWISAAFAAEAHPYHLVGATVTVGAAALVVVLTVQRPPWPLTAYAAGVVALAVGSGGLAITTPRLLLAAAPVLMLPIATGLAGRHRGTALAVTGAVVIAGCWFSAYALTAWQYAI